MYYLVICLRNYSSNGTKIGFKIYDNHQQKIVITKHHSSIKDQIMNNNYLAYIGTNTFKELADNFFAIKLLDSPKMEDFHKFIHIQNFMQYIAAFCTALWMVKDNAVTQSFGTISSNLENDLPLINRTNVINSNSKGSYETVEFSKLELKEAEKWFEKILTSIITIDIDKVEKPKGHQSMSNHIKLDTPSFERARHFLVAARRSEFVYSKVANYISILECLFAVEGENTHKVSERAAYFISYDITDRLKIFKQVIEAYNLRSKYVHGSEIKQSKHELLPEVSKNLDDIVRRVFKEIILNHPELNYNNSNKKDKTKKNYEEVNDWFNDLVLTKGV